MRQRSPLYAGIIAPRYFAEPMVRAIGQRQAERLLQLGLLVPPNEALRLGLVDELRPAAEVLPTAIAEAKKYAAIPARARYVASLSSRVSADGWCTIVVVVAAGAFFFSCTCPFHPRSSLVGCVSLFCASLTGSIIRCCRHATKLLLRGAGLEALRSERKADYERVWSFVSSDGVQAVMGKYLESLAKRKDAKPAS